MRDFCHLKNSELEQQFKKYRGRVVHRGDVVKDDSGSYAVFSEQRRFLPDYLDAKDEANAAVSAYTQVKTEDAPKLLRHPKSESPDSWVRLARHKFFF